MPEVNETKRIIGVIVHTTGEPRIVGPGVLFVNNELMLIVGNTKCSEKFGMTLADALYAFLR